MRRLIFIVFLLIGLAKCKDSASEQFPSQASQRLLDLVNTAKARGESSIDANLVIERESNATLEQVLPSDSVLIATPARSGKAVIAGDTILTPQEFRVDRWLSKKPGPPSYCEHLLVRGPAPQGSAIAGMMRGSVTIQGVRITELTESAMVFDTGRRYLLVVVACPDNKIGFKYGSDSIFVINSDGSISPASYNYGTAPFVADVSKLQTINALEAHLKKSEPSRADVSLRANPFRRRFRAAQTRRSPDVPRAGA
jgi:hypothetical protein